MLNLQVILSNIHISPQSALRRFHVVVLNRRLIRSHIHRYRQPDECVKFDEATLEETELYMRERMGLDDV